MEKTSWQRRHSRRTPLRQPILLLLLTLTALVYGQQPQVNKQHSSVICDHAAPPRGMHWRCDDPNDSCNCRLESDTPGGLTLDDDGPARKPEVAGTEIRAEDFYSLMNSLAVDWSSGNTARISTIFSEAAVYTDASRGQTYKGKAALSRLFGTSGSRPRNPKVEWHHLLFNEHDQIGAGEFICEGPHHSHGMVIVKISGAKISNWREYPAASSLTGQKLTSENPF